MMRINVNVSDEMNTNLMTICSRWGCSKSDLVSIILGQYLDGFDNKAFRDGFYRINTLKQLEKMQSQK